MVDALRAAFGISVGASREISFSRSDRPFLAAAGPRGAGQTLFCVSGLDALEQIAAAMPRKVPEKAANTPLSDDNFSDRRPANDRDLAFPSVWYSQGRVYGKVNLARDPKRGWFEIFVPKSV